MVLGSLCGIPGSPHRGQWEALRGAQWVRSRVVRAAAPLPGPQTCSDRSSRCSCRRGRTGARRVTWRKDPLRCCVPLRADPSRWPGGSSLRGSPSGFTRTACLRENLAPMPSQPREGQGASFTCWADTCLQLPPAPGERASSQSVVRRCSEQRVTRSARGSTRGGSRAGTRTRAQGGWQGPDCRSRRGRCCRTPGSCGPSAPSPAGGACGRRCRRVKVNKVTSVNAPHGHRITALCGHPAPAKAPRLHPRQ